MSDVNNAGGSLLSRLIGGGWRSKSSRKKQQMEQHLVHQSPVRTTSARKMTHSFQRKETMVKFKLAVRAQDQMTRAAKAKVNQNQNDILDSKKLIIKLRSSKRSVRTNDAERQLAQRLLGRTLKTSPTASERKLLVGLLQSKVAQLKEDHKQLRINLNQEAAKLQELSSNPQKFEENLAKNRRRRRPSNHDNPGLLSRRSGSRSGMKVGHKSAKSEIEMAPIRQSKGVQAIRDSVSRHQAELNRMMDEKAPAHQIQAKLELIETERRAARTLDTSALHRSVQANRVELEKLLTSGDEDPKRIEDLISRIELENSTIWFLEGKKPGKEPDKLHPAFKEPESDALDPVRNAISISLEKKTIRMNSFLSTIGDRKPSEQEQQKIDQFKQLIEFDQKRLAELDPDNRKSAKQSNRHDVPNPNIEMQKPDPFADYDGFGFVEASRKIMEESQQAMIQQHLDSAKESELALQEAQFEFDEARQELENMNQLLSRSWSD